MDSSTASLPFRCLLFSPLLFEEAVWALHGTPVGAQELSGAACGGVYALVYLVDFEVYYYNSKTPIL